MEYRLLGGTGIRVSVLGLGCGGFGGVGSAPELFGKGEEEKDAFAIMDRAVEVGINYFDTANSYGGGTSEAYIGRWLKSRGRRDQIVLSTKVFNRMREGANGAGLSRPAILREVEASLRRLETDHLDLYVTHEPDPDTPLEETLRTMDGLVRAGKVRCFGLSNESAWRGCQALWISDRLGLHRIESMQNSYSLLDRTAEAEILPFVADQGLAMTPFSPLAGGFLTGKYRLDKELPKRSRMTLRPGPYAAYMNEPTFRSIETLRRLAGERGVEPASLALAWVIAHPQVTAALVGPRSLHQFEPLAAAVEVRLSTDDREALGRALEAVA